MSLLLFSDNAKSTLASGISSGATALTVGAGAGALFPAPAAGQYFVLSITDAATQTEHEIVWVTNVTTDTLTIVRAQEGTTAQSWLAGAICFCGPTAGQMQNLIQPQQLQQQEATYFTDSGSANAYVVTMSPAPPSLTDGLIVSVKIAHTNTGASTLQVTGLAAESIVLPDGTAVPAGTLVAGQVVDFQYILSSTTWQIVSYVPTAKTQGGSDNSHLLANTAFAQATAAEALAAAETYAASVAATAQANAEAYANGTPALSNPGYMRFPGGLIVQWGNSLVTGSGFVINLPITFPNAIWGVTGTDNGNGHVAVSIEPANQAQLAVWAASYTVNLFWVAWGY